MHTPPEWRTDARLFTLGARWPLYAYQPCAAWTAVISPIHRLPQELIDEIIDKLSADVEALKSCSLTCRTWVARSSARLFRRIWAPPPGHDADFILAVQNSRRLSESIVRLELRFTSFDHFGLIRALPRLRRLSVSGGDLARRELLALTYSTMQPLHPMGRGLERLDAASMPAFLLEWLLQLFSSVDTLDISGIRSQDGDPLRAAHHIVRHLELPRAHAELFAVLPKIVDCASLIGLTLDGLDAHRGVHQEARDEFIKQYCSNVRTVSFDDRRLWGTYSPPSIPPLLSTCTNMCTVKLTSDALRRDNNEERWQLVLAFLGSMPPAVHHVKIQYHECWANGEAVVRAVRKVDWAMLGRVLLPYASLASFEIVVVPKRSVPERQVSIDRHVLRTIILASLPRSLQDITTIV